MKTTVFFLALAAFLSFLLPAQTVFADGDKGDTAFSAWAIVFNNPENCVGGCGEDDVGRVGVNGAVIFLTGQRVQSNGRAIFAGAVSALSQHRQIGGTSPNGLLDPMGSEIHVGLLPHAEGSLADPVAAHVNTTTPAGGLGFAQAAIFLPNAGDGAVVIPGGGGPVEDATAIIDRVSTGVTISVNTRIR